MKFLLLLLILNLPCFGSDPALASSITDWFVKGRDYLTSLFFKSKEISLQHKIEQIPIGDNIHVEVYTFIKELLLKEKVWTLEEVNRLISEETSILMSDEINKPYTASTAEGETSSLLGKLCSLNKNCLSLTIYQRNGVEIARGDSPSYKPNLPQSKEEKIEWGKNEVNLGTLGTIPHDKIGLTSSTDAQGKTTYNLIQPIYYNKERDYAYLAKEVRISPDDIIGYVRYLFQ